MEIAEDPGTPEHGSHGGGEVPSLIKCISANEVADFDSFSTQHHPTTSKAFCASPIGSKEVAAQPTDEHPMPQSVSISMPPTPTGYHFYGSKTAMFSDHDPTLCTNNVSETCAPNESEAAGSRVARFYSQPMPKDTLFVQSAKHEPLRARDTRFDSFKTWSGKLERQLTILRGLPVEPVSETPRTPCLEGDALPVDRYFNALEGPELDTLRPMEEAVLPDDKRWPFLLRFTVPSFGICLGISSQTILWKALATSVSTSFLHISLKVNLIMWLISVALVAVVGFIYVLKLIFYFEAVRREYYHPIRVNFFFAPWISLLFLCLGAPPSVFEALPCALWYILMAPVFFLELKIYGQWMSGGQRRLSKVANPCNHLSVVGNFVGALLGASMGLKEGPLFFFAIGLAHYTVLFVTLYQQLPTNETLPKELHPVFFLFIAAPSVASIAWAKIQGSFDYGARITYFIALFLYFSLAVRVNFFRGFRFSVAWWAYTFPMTAAAIATIRYSSEVTNWFTRCLAVVLCTASTLIVAALLATTIIHAFVLRDLFPNDNAIAISDRPPMPRRKWFNLGNGSADFSDIENYLKFASSDGNHGDAAPEKCVAEDTNGSSKRQDADFGHS